MSADRVPATSAEPQREWCSLRRPEGALLWLIIVGTAARLAVAWALGLGNGESYYFTSARHLSLSYLDQPPLALWIAHLSLRLTGSVDPLTLRGPFILMFGGTTWLMFVLGRKLFGPWPGFYAAAVMNLSAIFTIPVASWVQPDGPLMFFWLCCTLCLAHIFFTPQLKRPMWWWSLTGLALGLALLTKYHAAFLAAGAAAFAMSQPPLRRWVVHPGPYVALLIAAAVFSPVMLWNAQHDWISLQWQGNRAMATRGLRLLDLARSIGGQALWLSPWIWWPLVIELVRGFAHGRRDGERYFLSCLAVGPIVVFTLISLWAPLGFHFHWQAPGYLVLFAALGASVYEALARTDRRAVWVRRWMQASVVLLVLGLSVGVTHATTGWLRIFTPNWLFAQLRKPPSDPTLEALDYHGLEQVLARHGLLGRKDLFVFSTRWFQTGKVDYALRGQLPVLNFHRDARNLAFFERPEDWVGKDGVLVTPGHRRQAAEADITPYFERVTLLETLPLYRGRYVERTLYIYYCRKLLEPYPLPYGKRSW